MISMKKGVRRRGKKVSSIRADLLWKELLEHFLFAALEVFHPTLYDVLDQGRDPVFLNKELRIPGTGKGMKVVDLLVNVPLKIGDSASLLLHTELQGAIKDEPFHVRMYKYGCLITLRLGRPFTALAIRTTPKSASEEVSYETECFGTRTTFSYTTAFIDHMDEKRLLGMETNPVALVTAAAARILKAGRSEAKRFEYGREYLRMMKTSGYTLEERARIALFIEGMTNLRTERLIKELERDVSDVFEEGKSMQTMTPIVKRVLRKQAREWVKAEGRAEGKAEGKAEGMHFKSLETARLMLADGMFPDLISKFTGLSVEEVDALRE